VVGDPLKYANWRSKLVTFILQGNVKGLNVSYRSAKAALNMVTVDLARELAPDKITFIAMSPGWVQTKMSNWTGPGVADEAVASMIKVIDGVDFSHTGTFLHVDGTTIEW
jgi:NAD(P)-dependent dehydrogenase (short-subunit alcohol dehydrogenase family)